MRRHFFILTIVVASLILPIGAVAAQEANETASTSTAEPTGSSATIELSPTTKITEWRFTNGTFILTIKTEVPTAIAITDAGRLTQILSEGEGAAAGKARMRRLTLTPGTTTVEFRAVDYNGASAITITSSNANGIVAIRSDAMRTSRPPVDYGTVQQLLAGTAIAAAGGTFVWVRRKRNEKQMDARRVK